jgi:hypothetical protein
MSLIKPSPFANNPFAHPDSPAGGGGAGRFRLPRNPQLTGRVLLAQSGGGLPATGKATGTIELNFVGDFKPLPGCKTDADIIAAVKKDLWSPDGAEMGLLAKSDGGQVKTVPNILSLIVAIGRKPRESVRRVNIITHANKNVIALFGHVVRGDVLFDGGTDTVLDEFTTDKYEQDGYVFGEDKRRMNLTLERVRQSFAKNAVIVVYACHAGLNVEGLKAIASFFGVKVQGFKREIAYHLQWDKHEKRITGRKYSVGNSAQVSKLSGLVPDSSVSP